MHVLKLLLIASALMGDPNASIPTPQPAFYRSQFGAHGRAKFSTSVTFVSQAALRQGSVKKLGLAKRLVAVRNTRQVRKQDLLWNDATPKMEVDPETYAVKADGRILACEPARLLPLAQRYFLF